MLSTLILNRALCLILEDAQGVVAVAQCWTSAFIRNLVVHPRAHRRGLGLALLNRVFFTYRERGEGHVDLKVMESNLRARRLYERAGMQYIQRHELDPR
jgi:ribosomal protein S18 acetylase RimI-like enzyme